VSSNCIWMWRHGNWHMYLIWLD